MSEAPAWQVRTASVRGASHLRSGAPNEDAAGAYRSDDGTVAIACVADGHGSQRSFRSDAGSAIAVGIAIPAMRRIIDAHRGRPTAALATAARALPASILQAWQAAISADVAAEPILDIELERAGLTGPLSSVDLGVAYGATLLIVAVTPERGVFAQLGDGDIVWHTPDGVRRPLGDPAVAAGDATVSLASGQLALREWQVSVVEWATPPDLILLSTDGYANSFSSDADFLAVASDIHASLGTHGLDVVADSLPGWLREATRGGSGDDISVALLVPIGTDASPPPTAPTDPPVRSKGAMLVSGALILCTGIAIGWLAGSAYTPNQVGTSPLPQLSASPDGGTADPSQPTASTTPAADPEGSSPVLGPPEVP